MYLLFSDSRGIGPAVVRFFTRSKWSHVDIVLSDDLFNELTPIVGATTKGVISYKLGDRIEHAHRANAIRIQPKDEETVKEAITWLSAQVGKKYDWGAIFFAIGLNRDWRSDEDWFCSELGAAFALRCGMPVVDPDFFYRITPQDIYNSPFNKIKVK